MRQRLPAVEATPSRLPYVSYRLWGDSEARRQQRGRSRLPIDLCQVDFLGILCSYFPPSVLFAPFSHWGGRNGCRRAEPGDSRNDPFSACYAQHPANLTPHRCRDQINMTPLTVTVDCVISRLGKSESVPFIGRGNTQGSLCMPKLGVAQK